MRQVIRHACPKLHFFLCSQAMSSFIPPIADAAASYFTTPGGDRLAYHRLEGKSPGVVFLGGFRSDMTGSKATRLEAFCRARGQAFLRFDYHGHGQSKGEFAEGTIGRWAGNAIDMIEALTDGEQILVGSSMGGWMMLLAALALPEERVAGLLGIASAPDFTENLMWPALSEAQKAEMQSKGMVEVPSAYFGDSYPITMQLIEEARFHLLLEDEQIPLTCPVRLLHGMADEDVPWTLSNQLADKLASDDVQVTFIKDGDHRLSTEENLQLLEQTLAGML